MGLLEGFVLGVCGGAIPEIYAAYNVRFDAKRPEHFTHFFYWTMTSIMVLLGGVFVVLYLNAGVKVTQLLALHIGAATPLMIGALSSTKPNININ